MLIPLHQLMKLPRLECLREHRQSSYCSAMLLTSSMMGKSRRRSENGTLSESFFGVRSHVIKPMEIQLCNIGQICLIISSDDKWIVAEVQVYHKNMFFKTKKLQPTTHQPGG